MYIPKNYGIHSFSQDLVVGVIIAMVSIPISMGYALVAGLPVVYGLYGSVLPIIVFALISTSPRFIFGVDAAPAALVGGILTATGIISESETAIRLVPVITLLTALWLLLFFALNAQRILKFISQAVMGGFITGIGMTIICMQIPKLFGGTAGRGEIIPLLIHIVREAGEHFHLLSLVIGLSTIVLILLLRKWAPRFPMPAFLMFASAAATALLHLEDFGIALLPSVEVTLPFSIPDVSMVSLYWRNLLLPSMTIALVIFTETLLATSNLALKYEDKLNTRRELLAYALGNFAAAVSGSCPVNGSVSRSGIADQFGIKSQVASLTAGFIMIGILLVGTGFIAYLPVPVLTAIVISALTGTFEFKLAKRLRQVDKAENLIFWAAFLSVLLFGTIYGVLVGILLAALTFIIRQSKPTTDFLGIVPNQGGYYTLTRRGTVAFPIKQAVIYRFTGPLFYANISLFVEEIEGAIRKDTRVVVVDAGGIGSIDLTAAERLLMLYQKLKKRNILFFLAGHISALNDKLRVFGAGDLIYQRVVRPKIRFALEAAGIEKPYPLEEVNEYKDKKYSSNIAEFEWAFGSETERMMHEIVEIIGTKIKETGEVDMDEIKELVREKSYGYWNEIDEAEFLSMLELQVALLSDTGKDSEMHKVLEKVAARLAEVQTMLMEKNTDQIRRIVKKRFERDNQLRYTHPNLYAKVEMERERYFEEISMTHPELARLLADIIEEEELKYE